MQSIDVREETKRLVEQLPPNATWDDVMHEIYVRKTIERGLTDSEQGKLTESKEIRKRYGLPE